MEGACSGEGGEGAYGGVWNVGVAGGVGGGFLYKGGEVGIAGVEEEAATELVAQSGFQALGAVCGGVGDGAGEGEEFGLAGVLGVEVCGAEG